MTPMAAFSLDAATMMADGYDSSVSKNELICEFHSCDSTLYEDKGHFAAAQSKLVAESAADISESSIAHIISLLVFAIWKQIVQT